MNPALIVAILGAGGLGAIVAAIVTGLFSKRKLGAEATEIITKAAAGVVTSLQGELARSEAARQVQQASYLHEIEKIKADHAAEMDDVRRVLQLHVAWDAIAIAKMGELGVTLPPAPPLLPPRLQGEVH
jgi:hypothetical protein